MKEQPQQGTQRGDSGTVSVFLILVTVAMMLFTSLLIEFSRVAAFRKQAELAVKAGARSVLSSYDPAAYSRYGLFIRGGDSADEVLRETLEGHRSANDSGTFRYLDFEWSETEVTESRPLAEHGVFRRQVLEEMKYKAPINLTLELLSRFRGIGTAMKDATATVNALEKMRQAYDKREAALDAAVKSQEGAGAAVVDAYAGMIPYPAVSLYGVREAGAVVDSADASMMYVDYAQKKQEDAKRAEASSRLQEERDAKIFGPIHSEAIAAYETGMAAFASSLGTASVSSMTQAEAELARAAMKLAEAQALNAELRRLAEQAATMQEGGAAASSQGADEASSQTSSSLAEIRKSAASLVLPYSFFSDYRAELDKQRVLSANMADEASRFSSLAAGVTGTNGLAGALFDGADNLQISYGGIQLAYRPQGTVIAARKQLLAAHRSSDQERKVLEAKAAEAQTKALGWLEAVHALQSTPEDRRSFVQARKLYLDNLAWNKAEEERFVKSRPDDASEERNEALEATEGWLDKLTDSLAGARDAVYFGEFVYERFSRFEPSYVRDALRGAGSLSLSLDRMETEFALYGLEEPAANIAASYGEIFAFRLAIRTMEGLVENRAAGHPLVVLAASLVYGLTKALTDLNLLVQTGTVELSKYVRIDTTYGDYLRFFLLAHNGSANGTARCIAIIEQKLGLSFEKAYTYVSAEGRSSLRLWFFPGLLKVMGKTGSLGGKIRGNRYEAVYSAESSYQ